MGDRGEDQAMEVEALQSIFGEDMLGLYVRTS
jgi:hypothetical protein